MKIKIKELIGKFMLNIFGLKRSLKIYYKIKTGKKLDLDNPKRYTEKIQLRKLNYNNPLYIKCCDKYKVREYVKEKIGDEYLIPIYFAKETISEKDIKELPDSFVLKTNNASKTNIIVSDKKKLDIENTINLVNKYLKYKFGYRTFELFYNEVKPMVIAEKYIGTKDGKTPNDYKFHVFNNNGKPKIIISVDKDRFSNHARNFYDTSWNKLELSIGIGNINEKIEKPKNLDKMIDIALKLSEGFEYVRVDLYNLDGKIYFGELTFTHGSGYEMFTPDNVDMEWGSYWKD